MACSCRIVISPCSGGGNPTLVSVCSKSSLDHFRRMWSSDSHTPMMYKDSFASGAVVRQFPAWHSTPATHDQ